MLVEEIADPDAVSPDDVREEYEDAVAAVVAEHGVEAVAAETDVDEETLAALAAGERPALTVSEAVDVLALREDCPDAAAQLAELRDHVMLQMSSAVLDVDALADGVGLDLGPKELQQRIEGRQPMTLAEYAHVHHFVASQNPY